jgi:hypothetical protein
MKLAKSLLLGSAAGLVAVAGAQAADLPVRKAAPVEYVRICTAYGAGFFFIPGTDTCLRISGRVRAEYRVQEPFSRADSVVGWRARGRLNLDARTQTAYGTLRTFIRYELTQNSGAYTQGFGTTAIGANVAPAIATGVTGALSVDLNKAFIQFAGITAGRATSFFDFYANDLNWSGLPTGSDTYGNDPVVLAYTASFGSGFSATISLEDPNARRVGAATNTTFIVNPAVVGAGNVIAYGGQRMPEIVGNLRVDQAWGSAQISGAVHQLFAVNRVPVAFGAPLIVNPDGGSFVDTEYGFAISGGVKINAPFIAPGDVFWLQATYANGAVNYAGFGSSFNQGRVQLFLADAIVDGTGELKRTEVFNVHAAFLHYWTPQFRQALFGTYGRIDVANSVQTIPVLAGNVLAPGVVNNAFSDADYWQIGTNLIWSPVRDLDIGVEVLYREIDPRRRIRAADPEGLRNVRFVGDEGTFEGRLRIQRDF